MTTKFTAGPWEYKHGYLNNGHESNNDKMGSVCSEDEWVIAEICGDADDCGPANANLIAAAPEMYGFIKREFDETLCICKFKEWTGAICTHCQAGAILAKADGVQP